MHFAQLAGTRQTSLFTWPSIYSPAQQSDAIDRFVSMRVPVLAVHGSDNRVWSVSSSSKTIEALQASARRLGSTYDSSIDALAECPGYGHQDCIIGKDASQDVFPVIASFLL